MLGKRIVPEVTGKEPPSGHDSSARALIRRYRVMRGRWAEAIGMEKLHDLGAIKRHLSDNAFAFLYVSSEGCSVCVHLLPKVEALLSGFPQVVGRWAEVSEVPAIASELSVFSVPVLLLFVDGKETIRESRFVKLEELRAKLERYSALYGP